MKLIYKGKFSGDIDELPQKEHPEGAQKFKEPQSPKKLALIANGIATVICVAFMAWVIIATKGIIPMSKYVVQELLACVTSMLVIFPHELLHAVCFKDEVYLYTDFKRGMAFVMGLEVMSKSRFVILSLFPNLVFGVLPFVLWLIFPKIVFLGFFGALCLSQGAGDYMNVYNCLTQVPKGAKVYMSGYHSYWFKEN